MAVRVKSANTAHRSGSSGSVRPSSTSATGERKVVGQYMLGKTIGEGTFGKVKLAVHLPTGEKVAVKILEKSRIREQADVRRVNREIKILKKTRHPNIIQLYEVLDTESTIYLIMEHADGGEMFDYIVSLHRVPEREACVFFHQIINGVEALHQNFVTHRDLKPENLLLKPAPEGGFFIKIVDFGLSNTHEGGRLLQTACGSPCYAAPEMIAGKEYFGPIADMWSMGVILFALVCGYLPFEDQNTSVLYRKILSGSYTAPQWISSEVRDLIRRILETDPRKRITVKEIRQHPWYTQINENNIPMDVTYSSTNVDGGVHSETLAALSNAGVHIQAVLDGLSSHSCNGSTAMYHLLYKKLLRKAVKERERALELRSKHPIKSAKPTIDPEANIREREDASVQKPINPVVNNSVVPTKASIQGANLHPVSAPGNRQPNHPASNVNPNLIINVQSANAQADQRNNGTGVAVSPFSQQFQQQQPTIPPNTTRQQVVSQPGKSPASTPYHQPPVLPQQPVSFHFNGLATNNAHGHANGGGDDSGSANGNASAHATDLNEKRAHSAGSTRSGGFRGVRILKMPQHLGGNVMVPVNSPYVQVPKLNLPAVAGASNQQPSPFANPAGNNVVVTATPSANNSPRAVYINELSDRVAAGLSVAPTPTPLLVSQTAREHEPTKQFHLELSEIQGKHPLTARTPVAPSGPQPTTSQSVAPRRPAPVAVSTTEQTTNAAPVTVANSVATSKIITEVKTHGAGQNIQQQTGQTINASQTPQEIQMEEGFRFAPTIYENDTTETKKLGDDGGVPVAVPPMLAELLGITMDDVGETRPSTRRSHMRSRGGQDSREAEGVIPARPQSAMGDEGMDAMPMHGISRHMHAGDHAARIQPTVVATPAPTPAAVNSQVSDLKAPSNPSAGIAATPTTVASKPKPAPAVNVTAPSSSAGPAQQPGQKSSSSNKVPGAILRAPSPVPLAPAAANPVNTSAVAAANPVNTSAVAAANPVNTSAVAAAGVPSSVKSINTGGVAGAMQWSQTRPAERPPVVKPQAPAQAQAPSGSSGIRPTFSAGGRRGKNISNGSGLTGIGL